MFFLVVYRSYLYLIAGLALHLHNACNAWNGMCYGLLAIAELCENEMMLKYSRPIRLQH